MESKCASVCPLGPSVQSHSELPSRPGCGPRQLSSPTWSQSVPWYAGGIIRLHEPHVGRVRLLRTDGATHTWLGRDGEKKLNSSVPAWLVALTQKCVNVKSSRSITVSIGNNLNFWTFSYSKLWNFNSEKSSSRILTDPDCSSRQITVISGRLSAVDSSALRDWISDVSPRWLCSRRKSRRNQGNYSSVTNFPCWHTLFSPGIFNPGTEPETDESPWATLHCTRWVFLLC